MIKNIVKFFLFIVLSLLAPIFSRGRYIDIYTTNSFSFLRRKHKMIQITNEQKVALTAQPRTAAGLPAIVDGQLTWTLSDPSLGTLVVGPDTYTCEFISGDTPGFVTVTVEADADLTEGTLIINGAMDIEIVSALASFIEVTAGTPVSKF